MKIVSSSIVTAGRKRLFNSRIRGQFGCLFYVGTPSGVHLFDHLLWSIFQSLIYFHLKILALAGIWTWDLLGTKPICYQLSYPGLDFTGRHCLLTLGYIREPHGGPLYNTEHFIMNNSFFIFLMEKMWKFWERLFWPALSGMCVSRNILWSSFLSPYKHVTITL